jgi:hypothetical protein
MLALIKNGVVVQVQPYEEAGFVTVPAGTVCGMAQNADGSFSAPGPTLGQAQAAQIALLQSAFPKSGAGSGQRHARSGVTTSFG